MHNYITKKIRELLIGNLRFVIQNLMNRLLWYTNIKDSCLFVAETVETLDLSILGKIEGLAQFFHVWILLKTKNEKALRLLVKNCTLEDTDKSPRYRVLVFVLKTKRINNSFKFIWYFRVTNQKQMLLQIFIIFW